ncbi:MAG: flagellar hook-basal body protein [Phycisphaerales bacterium]|nr:flagellar hook-basal body protein [Phycisphaerales bacterium]
MIYGLYNSAAGMMVDEYRQSVIANNLANADTVGFQRDVAVFAERLPASEAGRRSGASAPDLAGLSGGLWLGRTHTDFSPGQHVKTDNPLDVALAGPGFLSVSVAGERQYTRDGRMVMDADGRLVSALDGSPYLGRGGMPIRLNPRGGQPEVTRDGRIMQDAGLVAELELTDFPDPSVLRKTGNARLAAPPDTVGVEVRPELQPGYIEQSAVQTVPELVDMIAASRSYQMNAQMITLADQTLGRLIAIIAR